MDETHAEAEGAKPLAPENARIEKVRDVATLTAEIARLRPEGVGVLWSFGSGQDARDSKEVIAEADQSGLGLPDRDYYTKEDEASKTLRAQYVEHMGKMFELAGDTPHHAKAEADAVMAIETELAKASMTRVERRDPKKRYNRMNLAELGALAPAIPWKAYLAEAGVPAGDLGQHRLAFVLQGPGRALEDRKARELAVLPALACHPHGCPDALLPICRHGVRLLRNHPDGGQGPSASLEALRDRDRSVDARAAGPAVRRAHVWSRGQEAHERDGPGSAFRDEGGPRGRQLDGRRNEGEGPGEARHIRPQDRLSGQVGRLHEAFGRAGRHG